MNHQLNLSVDWPVQFSILLGNPVHGKSKWFFVIWNQICIENDRFNNSEAMFHLKTGWNQEIANLLHPSKSLIIHSVCQPPTPPPPTPPPNPPPPPPDTHTPLQNLHTPSLYQMNLWSYHVLSIQILSKISKKQS